MVQKHPPTVRGSSGHRIWAGKQLVQDPRAAATAPVGSAGLVSAEIPKSRMERGDLGIKAAEDCYVFFPAFLLPLRPPSQRPVFYGCWSECLPLRPLSPLPFTFFGGRTSSKMRKLHIPARKLQIENKTLPQHPARVVPVCRCLPGAVPRPREATCCCRHLVPVPVFSRMLLGTRGRYEAGWIFSGDNQQVRRKENECP